MRFSITNSTIATRARHKTLLGVAAAASVALCASPRASHAQAFNVLYDFFTSPGTQTFNAPTAATVPAGVSAGNLVRGAGLTSTTAGVNSINSAGFTSNSTTLLLSDNDYYAFTVGPSTGVANFATLAYTDQRSGTGPQNFSIRASSTNNSFATELFSYTSTGTTGSRTFDLSTITSLQNVTAPVEFRIYGYNSTGAGGTYRLTSATAGTGLTVSGTLVTTAAAAPEPGTLALLGTCAVPGMGLLAARRRRARKTA